MAKLTKSYIDKIKLPESGYKVYWDDDVKGFGLRANAQGRLTFIYQGRIRGPGGMKSAVITIGSAPSWTVDQARKKAKALAVDMDNGIDPRAAKRADQAAAVTLADVAAEYTGRPGKLKERSKQEIQRHVDTTLEKWKDKPVASITEDMCRKRYNEILTKGLRGNGPAPGQANQAFSVLRALINYAMRRYKKTDGTPLITHNPVGVLKDDWVTLPERNTRIPESKIGAVWFTLEQIREEAYNRTTLASIDLVMFLILTGARFAEAAQLTWGRVNLEEGWWHLPDPKNRNPVWLPLSKQAVQLLETRQRVERSPHVFTTWSKDGHIKDARATLEAVSKVSGTKITAHDLRRTFITYGVTNCGIDFYKIELLTNHVPKGVTARHYLETNHLQYLKPEVQAFADWVSEKSRLAEVVSKGDNVVPLKA
jgi:integrase